MKILKILSASITGTLAMTLCGNLISENKIRKVNEPLLLNMPLGRKWTLFPENDSYFDGRLLAFWISTVWGYGLPDLLMKDSRPVLKKYAT